MQREMCCPLVTVVIPTYDRMLELSQLLEALTRQTYRDFEVVVVSDGGPDASPVTSLYPELDLRLVTLPHNQGRIRASNAGLHLARGQFVAQVDDDDLLLPRHLELMLEALRSADLVYGDVEIVELRRQQDRRVVVARHPFAMHFDAETLRWTSTIVPSAVVYRTSLHQQLGWLDTRFEGPYWDWDWFLRVAQGHRIARVAQATVLYAWDGNNYSADPQRMQPYLELLAKKHQLGSLETSNFYQLARDDRLVHLRAETQGMWDGDLPAGRWAR